MKRILSFFLGMALAVTASANIIEGFDDITTLPAAGWVEINRSEPLGVLGYFQGNATVFPAQAGPSDSYLAANYNSTGDLGTISNWMILPEVTLRDGDTLSFWTRTATDSGYPDRLQVRMSLSGSSTDVGASATSVGVFTNLLLDIDPNYLIGVYPETWTEYTLTVSGIGAPTQGRLAFRYFVENAGALGLNSNYIGIDTLAYTQVPEPASLALAALGLLGLRRR